MEKQYYLAVNGQQMVVDDVNTLGESSGLADDRVFAELFRLAPTDGSTVARGILPTGNAALVAPNGNTGSVLVNPFRAFVGSRTAVSADAKKNWRDVRSAIGVGSTTLAQTVALAPNASGNPRWDLVYATLHVDAYSNTVSRKVKNPGTAVIAAQNVSTFRQSFVTLGVVAGSAAASPVWPALPADGPGDTPLGGQAYRIPLAYVRVPNGFGASSTVATTDVAEKAPIMQLSRAVGGGGLTVADSQHAVTPAQQQAWGSSGTRNVAWIPPTAAGTESLIAFVDLGDASSANWSHQNNGVVDSRDWRGRFCRVTVLVANGAPALAFPWQYPDQDGTFWAEPLTRMANKGDTTNGASTSNQQTMAITTTPDASGHSNIAIVEGSETFGSAPPDGSSVTLYVDHNDGGKLKIAVIGLPTSRFGFWIDWSGPYTNK